MRQCLNRTWQSRYSHRRSLGQIGERRIVRIRPASSDVGLHATGTWRRSDPTRRSHGVHERHDGGLMDVDGERREVVKKCMSTRGSTFFWSLRVIGGYTLQMFITRFQYVCSASKSRVSGTSCISLVSKHCSLTCLLFSELGVYCIYHRR